jgi:hypothetical protein
MASKKGKGGEATRPGGSIRRSQILTAAGPGALVDLLQDAAMVGGLDAWRYAEAEAGFIQEPRLEASVQRHLSGQSWWRHERVRLRLPPECDDDRVSPKAGISAVRFPRWSLCQNPSCRSLLSRGQLEGGRHRCRLSSKDDKGLSPVVPVRFVTACARGHMQDIDWSWFVHRGEGSSCRPGGVSRRRHEPLEEDWSAVLYLESVGTSGELADYVAGCRACGRTRGLQDLQSEEVLRRCPGWRPWLGEQEVVEACDKPVRLLTRTASNAWFAQIKSALSIPDPAEEIRRRVGAQWSMLQNIREEGMLQQMMELVPSLKEGLSGLKASEVMEELERRRQGREPEARTLREVEWEALMRAEEEEPGELAPPGEVWFARRARLELPWFLERVVLVHHLKEVRALVGFSRVDAPDRDAEGEYSLEVEAAPLGLGVDWVPAVEIYGEGVFLAFDQEALSRWEARGAVEARAALFAEGARRASQGRSRAEEAPSARLVMLHSLSHMLIQSISLECGYPATSIRERLYHGEGRAGILLYTGTPGSEGTLGGLVSVGRQIVHHLRRAVSMAGWCSNDPICAQHDPSDAQEGRHREGAACHGCLLIGEPSCERGNRDLDRAFVVATLQGGAAAFLGDWGQG